jgi:hypothetical protein
MYCHVKWLSTDVSEVRTASIIRDDETSVDNHFTRQYIQEDNSEHHTRRRENLKSQILSCVNLVVEYLNYYQNIYKFIFKLSQRRVQLPYWHPIQRLSFIMFIFRRIINIISINYNLSCRMRYPIFSENEFDDVFQCCDAMWFVDRYQWHNLGGR